MILLHERVLRAAAAQEGPEAVACHGSSELVKDAQYTPLGVETSTMSDEDTAEDVAEDDDAEGIRRLLRRLVLKGARFCPKTGAPGQQQMHDHLTTETDTLLGGQAGELEQETAMHIIPSHSCMLDEYRRI